jgi:hypothetical protein
MDIEEKVYKDRRVVSDVVNECLNIHRDSFCKEENQRRRDLKLQYQNSIGNGFPL